MPIERSMFWTRDAGERRHFAGEFPSRARHFQSHSSCVEFIVWRRIVLGIPFSGDGGQNPIALSFLEITAKPVKVKFVETYGCRASCQPPFWTTQNNRLEQ